MTDGCMFETYFGLWSPNQRERVTHLLVSLGIRFEFISGTYAEEALREWAAWDESSAQSGVAFDLFVLSDDAPKIGTKLVEMYPEKANGAARSGNSTLHRTPTAAPFLPALYFIACGRRR